MIELRSVSAPATPTRLSIPAPELRKPEVAKPPVVIRAFQPPPRAVTPAAERPLAPLPSPPILARTSTPLPVLLLATATTPPPPPDQPGPPPLAKVAAPAAPVKSAPTPPEVAPEVGKAARRTAAGETSLTRALGLKLNRVVIDAGHGGHDQGTAGVKGLLEKDLVLDVALRVGKLIEDRLRAEVIYTRSTDVFIPLESRTALANEKKADLFLSIHANASSAPSASGVETYFLNFTESKDAMGVAARENASSLATISELHDLIRQITLHDKAEESRDLAGNIQASLFGLYSRNFPGEHDRGVRRAPFVVLIGATMPSVLAEIGFLTNPKEEALLRKPEYRQKVAEAVVRGVERYAGSLSHFQVAQNK
jgi:N-acetylmuramoyl-L-alanine amidase